MKDVVPMSNFTCDSKSKERCCLILFSLDKIIAIIGIVAGIMTATAKASDAILD
ncbi:hypothetical protein [Enterococcus songbeiensis]